ncbi:MULTISPECIES: hypothetical protein [unclassified Microcoleus]|uniref:hypothetical protein n=2 Tax=unclassified Microcoleus TaxID=2642155 RepID=UPI002FD12CB1
MQLKALQIPSGRSTMKTINFPIRNPGNSQENPLAFVSGDIIHILYPNGEVEATTVAQIDRRQTKNPLDKCLVWGCVDDF